MKNYAGLVFIAVFFCSIFVEKSHAINAANAATCSSFSTKSDCLNKVNRKAYGCKYDKKEETCYSIPSVTFVGNSFTKSKQTTINAEFGKVAKSGDKKIKISVIASNGFTLERHLGKNAVEKSLKKAKDYVILQEQSQYLQFSSSWWAPRTGYAIQQWKKEADPLGVEILLFNTWGYAYGDSYFFNNDNYEKMQTRINNGYSSVASMTDTTNCPVGSVWAKVVAHLKNQGSTEHEMLYRSDLKHESKAGHYLAALTFYGCIFGESPVGIEYKANGVSDELALKMQEYVAEVLNL